MPQHEELEFTPLEFETQLYQLLNLSTQLEFTPLEFENILYITDALRLSALEFTPLEFETKKG